MKKFVFLFIVPLIAEGDEIVYLEPTLLPETQIVPQDAEFKLPKKTHKSLLLALSLNALSPGSGHAYINDWKRTGDPFFRPRPKLTGYNFYATYRDVREYNGNSLYAYPMPKNSMEDLILSPFQWSVIKKPEVWGGILGALAAGLTLSHVVYSVPKDLRTQCLARRRERFPLEAFSIAIEEESFFRGFLQPLFSEGFSPVGGIILSSILFGAAHIPNASDMGKKDRLKYYRFSIPYITLAGGYFGWLNYKNQSLKECVAVHAWYDFTLFLINYSAVQSALIGKPSVGFSFSF